LVRLEGNRDSPNAAEVVEHAKNGVTCREVLVDRIGAVDGERSAFAENQKARRMIDVAIDQYDPGNPRVANPVPRLHLGKRIELLSDVR
jgi:hypothetical protein